MRYDIPKIRSRSNRNTGYVQRVRAKHYSQHNGVGVKYIFLDGPSLVVLYSLEQYPKTPTLILVKGHQVSSNKYAMAFTIPKGFLGRHFILTAHPAHIKRAINEGTWAFIPRVGTKPLLRKLTLGDYGFFPIEDEEKE